MRLDVVGLGDTCSGTNLTIKVHNGSAEIVTVSDSTRYQKAGQSASLADVTTGTMIQAEGTTTADGSLSAQLVTIQTPRVMGQVTGVSNGSYTITGRAGSGSVTVTTTTATVYVNASGTAVLLATMVTGTRISAVCTLSADGKTLAATRITVVPAGANGGHVQGHKAAPGATATAATTATPASGI